MIPRLAQGAAQYRNRLADRARAGEAIAVACGTAIVIAAMALAQGGYSAGAAAGFGAGCWWVVFALVALRLAPVDAIPRWALLAGSALFALAAFTFLSRAWAADDAAAYRAAVLAFLYVGVFSLVVLTSRRGSIRGWLNGLALGLGAVCVLALATRWFPGFHHDDVTSSLPDAKGRLSYPLGYWNALGSALALLVVLLGWLAGSARSGLGRAAASGALVLPALGIFLTSSRGAVIAGAVGLLVLLAVVEKRSRLIGSLAIAAPACAAVILVADSFGTTSRSEGFILFAVTAGCAFLVAAVRRAADGGLERVSAPRGTGWAAVVGAVVVLAIGAIAAKPAERWDHFKALPAPIASGNFAATHLASGSGSGRYQFWKAAIDAFQAEPLRGIGAGGYEAWWAEHGEFSYPIKNAHSLFLETLAELGLIGLTLLLAFFAATAIAGVTRLRAGPRPELGAALAVVAAGVVSAAIDWTWQLPAAFAGVVIAAGLLTGPAGLLGAETATAPPERPRPATWAWRAAAAAGCLLLAGVCGVQLLSSLELDRSQRETRSGNLSQAADAARKASAIEPWSGPAYLQLALVQERAGDLNGAIASINQATAHDDQDWGVWLTRARLLAERGDATAASAALARARQLNPRSPVFTFLPANTP
jgi:tetratricopeptide (TPR) repeat protein